MTPREQTAADMYFLALGRLHAALDALSAAPAGPAWESARSAYDGAARAWNAAGDRYVAALALDRAQAPAAPSTPTEPAP
jgi:hypothetical protein